LLYITHVSILLSNNFNKTFVLHASFDWLPNYHNSLLFMISECCLASIHYKNLQSHLSHGYDRGRFLKDFFYQEYPPLIKTHSDLTPNVRKFNKITLNIFKILNLWTELLLFWPWAFAFTVWHMDYQYKSFNFRLKQNL